MMINSCNTLPEAMCCIVFLMLVLEYIVFHIALNYTQDSSFFSRRAALCAFSFIGQLKRRRAALGWIRTPLQSRHMQYTL